MQVGQRVGVYEVLGPLGSGGMGEVYRARDTRLKRDVALKILSAPFTNDTERLARFEREAQLLATLNHPNVGAIYGLEEHPALAGPCIVMELVEGDTLADRLAAARPLPVGEVVAIARQIASGLAAAHEKGIVHRDLKPANIKITPQGIVKLLDFGLARQQSATSEDGDHETTMMGMTQRGVIVGTAPYMSPEQARAQPVDKRTDLWAFGCVVYEMLSGRRAFPGATMSDTIAAILEREPDWSRLPATTPANLTRLLRACLDKDARTRIAEIREVAHELDQSSTPSSATTTVSATPAARGLSLSPRAIGVAALVLIAGAAIIWTLRNPATRPAQHMVVTVQPATRLLGSQLLERQIVGRARPSRTAIALSPDGGTLAFTAQRDETQQLYVRSLAEPDARAIADTENSDNPFFSPDGGWIGFWSGNALKKVPVSGGAVVSLCDGPIISGASWSEDGTIYFSRERLIWSVPASGGQPKVITALDFSKGDARHVLPAVLPGNKWIIFTALSTVNDWDKSRVEAQSLTTGERKVILTGAADARYLPTGHLAYMRLGTLQAAPFDPERVAITGGEVTVRRDVMQSVNSATPIALDTGGGQYAFARSGALAYVTGGVHHDIRGEAQWIARDGTVEPIPIPDPPRPFFLPRLSPDGTALAIGTLGLQDQNLWRYDFAHQSLTRLTTEGRAEQPLWSPDGTRLAFTSTRAGTFNLFVTRADGGDSPRQITSGLGEFAGAWTPDGHSLVFADYGDISIISVDPPAPPRKLVATPFSEKMPDLSPDGRWLAYVSNESGENAVYVRSFVDLGGKRRVSPAHGTEPAWSRDGKKLLFLSSESSGSGKQTAMVEIDITSGTRLTAGPAHVLFRLDPAHYALTSQARGYDLPPNASRFVFVHESYVADSAPPAAIELVGNWFDELRRQVPAR